MKRINATNLIYDISYVIGKGLVTTHEKYEKIKRAAYDNPEVVAILGPLFITLIGEIWRNHQLRKIFKKFGEN